MTAEERLLLHLRDNPLPERAWDVESTLTQAGIAESTFIQRKHVPRTLKLAIKRNLVEDDTRHIIGSKQRRKVYRLTPEGVKNSTELRNRLLKMVVEKDGEKQPIADFIGHDKLLSILAHIDEKCLWNDEPLSRHKAPTDVKIAAEAIFTSVLGEAWSDGQLSRDEIGIINVLRKVLNFPEDELDRLNKVASESVKGEISEKDSVYLNVLLEALADGQLIREEDAMLARLRSSLGLSEADHRRMIVIAESKLELDGENHNIPAYADALRVALADKIITEDEEALLKTFRKTLDISDQQHQSLVDIERAKLN